MYNGEVADGVLYNIVFTRGMRSRDLSCDWAIYLVAAAHARFMTREALCLVQAVARRSNL